MKHIIGIDPGLSGGFAWTDFDGNPVVAKMPETEGDILDFIKTRRFEAGNPKTAIMIERAPSAMPGQVSGLAKLNANAAFIRGVCMTLGMTIYVIQPQAWQKPLGLGTRSACKDSGQWKNKLKGKAQQLFPSTDGITLKTCDALLILHHANNL